VSPTQRALAHCKKQGWVAYVTDRWNSFAKVRQDLLGFIDLIVLDGNGGGPLGVQVTTGAHVAERIAKIRAEPRSAAWLASPARIEVWGWSKQGARGKRKLWELRRVNVAASDFASVGGQPGAMVRVLTHSKEGK
jgi:hypothetical protein